MRLDISRSISAIRSPRGNNVKDFKTTMAGFLTLGLMTASFLVKNQDTKTTLQGLAGVVGSAGLMLAKDSTNTQASPPLTPGVPAIVVTPAPVVVAQTEVSPARVDAGTR